MDEHTHLEHKIMLNMGM